MRSVKGSRRIVVEGVSYRWRATGNDGHIVVSIWPTNNTGPSIHGHFAYHETMIDKKDGGFSSAGDQIVVTSRLIRRVIDHAIRAHRFNPLMPGKPLEFQYLENRIEWSDAVRAS